MNGHIRDIISQPKPTVDFAEIMQARKIVLLRLPMSPSDDETRSFIGTLVVSQLLKVIFLRADISENLRVPFALYCDEFHNFATPDFAKLFAQTRKFKIMPVVAHQVRKQLKPGDPNKSATLGAPNKVHFSLSTHDAEEFAKEVSKKPPANIKLEPQMVISQSPVSDLLKGHVNPQIREFVDLQLRPMQKWAEDIKEEIERRKLIRTEMMDEAAISRLDAQVERERGILQGHLAIRTSLTDATKSVERSLYETNILQDLHSLKSDLDQNMDSLDRFLTAVMERQITPRHKEFADFITSYIQNFPGLEEKYKQALKQHIQLQYGDSAQVLKQNEKETIRKAYFAELLQCEKGRRNGLGMLVSVNEFARFCDLLSKPENHIKKPTGQYIEKEVPLRTEADMVGEMRRELISLPNYTAYAKIMQSKYKITTFALPVKWPEDVSAKIQQEVLDRTYREYCQKREIIENQIKQKQAAWQKDLTIEPLPGRRR